MGATEADQPHVAILGVINGLLAKAALGFHSISVSPTRCSGIAADP
jgi:hypothetical protein